MHLANSINVQRFGNKELMIAPLSVMAIFSTGVSLRLVVRNPVALPTMHFT